MCRIVRIEREVKSDLEQELAAIDAAEGEEQWIPNLQVASDFSGDDSPDE